MQILLTPFLAISLTLGAPQDGQGDEPPPEPKEQEKNQQETPKQEVDPAQERPKPAAGDATERRPQRPPIVRTERRDARPIGTGAQGDAGSGGARPADGARPAGSQADGARPDATPGGRRDAEATPAGGARGVGEAQGRDAQRVPGSRGATPGEAPSGDAPAAGGARPGEVPAGGSQRGDAGSADDGPAGQDPPGGRPAGERPGPRIDRGQARALLQELVHHRERHAKIDKLIAIFEARGDEDGAAAKAARARELKTKEDARHAAALARFREKIGVDEVDAILQQIATRSAGGGASRGAGRGQDNGREAGEGPGVDARRQETPPAARGDQRGGGRP